MEQKHKVLVVEDDSQIAEIIQDQLREGDFDITWCTDGRVVVDTALRVTPQLVLLDLTLPGMGGLEILRELKKLDKTSRIPVIVVTGRTDEADIVQGLEIGAEDYVTKPFRSRELLARIRVVMRRYQRPSNEESVRLQLGNLLMDASRHEAQISETVLPLTPAEFRLLWTLVSSPGRVYTREQLLSKIARHDANVVDRNVDVHIGSLRKKMGNHGHLIVTVRGIGYKCQEEAQMAA